jgi:glutamate 5-kinase
VVGKGIVNLSAAELGRVKEMKTSQVQEFPPRADEAVHRDRFVLT